MAVQLSSQQVHEFKIRLRSRFIEMQRDLEQESELVCGRLDSSVDNELEGCINLLFDLNYADSLSASESPIPHGQYY